MSEEKHNIKEDIYQTIKNHPFNGRLNKDESEMVAKECTLIALEFIYKELFNNHSRKILDKDVIMERMMYYWDIILKK